MRELVFKLYAHLFARRVFRGANRFLYELSLRGMGILNYQSPTLSGEKYFIEKILPKYLPGQGAVIFDVGANVGNYSKMLTGRFTNADVYAFEPHPKNFIRLSQVNVKAYNIGLGSNVSEMTMFDRADHEGSSHASLYESVISEIHQTAATKCSVLIDTLDNVATRENISKIHLLKIDTEGNELEVLKGAALLLEKNAIDIIHFEFNEMNVISRAFMRDFRMILCEFDCYRLLPSSMIKLRNRPVLSEIFAYQNIVAFKKGLK